MTTKTNKMMSIALALSVAFAPVAFAKSGWDASDEARRIAEQKRLEDLQRQKNSGSQYNQNPGSNGSNPPAGNGWNLPGNQPGNNTTGVGGDYGSGSNSPSPNSGSGGGDGGDYGYDPYGDYSNSPSMTDAQIKAEADRKAKEDTEGWGSPSLNFAFCLFMTATVSPHKIVQNKGCLKEIKGACSLKHGFPDPPECAVFPFWAY